MKNNLENLTKLADFVKNYGADLIIMGEAKGDLFLMNLSSVNSKVVKQGALPCFICSRNGFAA